MEDSDSREDVSFQFMVAAQKGKIHKLEALLAGGFDINTRDLMFTETALMKACRFGYVDAIQVLLRHGADINAVSDYGKTALHIAVINSHLLCLEFLLGCENILKDIQDEMGETPLMKCAWKGNVAGMEKLISHSCSLNVQNHNGLAAVHYCLVPYDGFVGNHNGYRCLRLLTNAGADINVKDNTGLTPTHYAVKGGNFWALKWLISENCELDAKGSFDRIDTKDCFGTHMPVTPFLLAVYFLNERMIHLLANSGCDIYKYSCVLEYCTKNPSICSWLKEYFITPKSLKCICRIVIRFSLGQKIKDKVEDLKIPDQVKHFILLKEHVEL